MKVISGMINTTARGPNTHRARSFLRGEYQNGLYHGKGTYNYGTYYAEPHDIYHDYYEGEWKNGRWDGKRGIPLQMA